jgi:hypothetical protein
MKRSVAFLFLLAGSGHAQTAGWHFPPPGDSLQQQARREPEQVGLNPAVVEQLKGSGTRWALWRHGYLIHVEGNWNETIDVASLRKTWHAMSVGAFLAQGKIPLLDQKVSVYNRDLKGNHAAATWRNGMMQASGFDYPDARYPTWRPPAASGRIGKSHGLCAPSRRRQEDPAAVTTACPRAHFDAIN